MTTKGLYILEAAFIGRLSKVIVSNANRFRLARCASVRHQRSPTVRTDKGLPSSGAVELPEPRSACDPKRASNLRAFVVIQRAYRNFCYIIPLHDHPHSMHLYCARGRGRR